MTPHPTRVSKVSLWAFRNYAYQQLHLTLDPSSHPTREENASDVAKFVLLVGPNGAGKTNILEGLSYLAPGRGLRKAPLAHLYHRSSSSPGSHDDPSSWMSTWAVSATVGNTVLSTGLDPEAHQLNQERRVGRIDGAAIKNLGAFEAHLRFYWLIPTLDALFRDSPGVRRSFLDKLVERWDPSFSSAQGLYERAMRQRLALLRSKPETQWDRLWLAQLEEQMTQAAMSILHGRQHYLDALHLVIRDRLDQLPAIEFHQGGHLEKALSSQTYPAVEAYFQQALEDNRRKDALNGTTTLGPHTTNFQAFFKDKGIYADHCSMGEIKIMLLSLLLGAAHLDTLKNGTTPILLLDEVMTHLDSQHRGALTHELNKLSAQVFMTSTDASAFRTITTHNPDSLMFTIHNGTANRTL